MYKDISRSFDTASLVTGWAHGRKGTDIVKSLFLTTGLVWSKGNKR